MRILILRIAITKLILIFFYHHDISVNCIHEKVAPPPGTSSLTFVFDTTGSMNDDLIQVQDGAKKILDTVLKQREKLIYNFVYVPFHDPRVGPVFSTTDPRAFQRHLNSVHVVGGGDCPEMALSGIQLALTASLPASYIYVFTDGRAKDYHLEDQILNLIQEKQSSVVLVMTGDCNNRSHPGFQCYEKVAAASFGQVFHLEKTDINKVLNYVRHSITFKKVHIMYEIRDHSGTFLCQIPVDRLLTELTISLSADKDDDNYLDISLIDPKGTRIDRAQLSNETGSIDLNNIKLIRIRNPMPGNWKIRTSSRVKHTLRVLGHGPIDFKYGFALKLIDKVELSHPRPVAYQRTYLIVNMKGLPSPGILLEISLVDYYGKELLSKPAIAYVQNPYLYYIGPFVPPRGLFFVRVRGKDNQSYEFQRIAPTAVSAVQTTGPRAYMTDRITAIVSQPFNLTCSVVSKDQFTLYWYKGNKQLGGPHFYPYSDTSVWTFKAITPEDRGDYHCMVISPFGNHTVTTFLETEEPAPEITFIRNESVARGNLAFLHCRTQNLNAIIQWLKRDSVIENTTKTRLYTNGTLMISDVNMQDAGIYRCRVQTPAGRAEAIMHLHVLEAPKVHVTPHQLYFVRGQSFNISCTVNGDMLPEPKWYFKGRRIIPDHQKYYITYKYDLIVQRATEADIGVYECHASNAAGSHADSTMVKMSTPPKIRVIRDRQMVGRGDHVTLECKIEHGNPKPKISWFRGGREIQSHRYITIDQNKLMIEGVQDSDAGSYTCIAQNLAGRDSGIINLDVGSMPTIVPTPEIVRVNIERSVTLQCRAIGYPLPKITWHRNGIPIEKLPARIKILPDGSLLINNVQVDDQDRYTCTAENTFGRQVKATVLLVTGLVSPVLGHMSPEEKLIEGGELRLSCIPVLGTPKPTLRWYKDGKPLQSSAHVTVKSGGSILLLHKGRPEDEGQYTCVATNSAGNASLNVNIELIKKPYIKKSDASQYTTSTGKVLEIPCHAIGKPPPKVIWSIDGKPISSSNQEYEILPDNTLRIRQTSSSHTGKYTCTASNVAGEAKIATNVIILGPPVIEPGQVTYSLIQGNPITLPCKVRSDSIPTISWYLNGKEFKNGLIDKNGSLTIEKVEEQHRGQFKCVASNDIGKDEKVITLTVHTAPIIEGSDQLKVLITNVNQSILLPCPARAFPLPSRIWSYENDRIYDGYSHGSEIRYTHDGSLEIVTPQMNHAGRYTCHVSNLAGDDQITYLLKIHEPPKIISDIPGTIVIVLGLMLEIPCRAIGTPEPTISWEKDGFQVIPDDIIQTDSAGTILIEKAQPSHRGIYRCLATNPAGRDERDTLVIVQEPPTISPNTLSDYTTVEGDRIELHCFASANPSPTITWSRKGIPILDDTPRMHVNKDGTLIIDNVENDDAGHYICKASNAAGDAEKVVRLTVIIPPDIPDQETIATEAAVIGQSFSLYCPVFSIPLPQITWYLDDRLISKNDANIVLSDDQRRLHILKSRVIDAGSYKCVARNPAGDSAKTFQVEIIVPPNLNQSLHKIKVTVLKNEHIELGCPISGIPEPDIAWLVNGQLLEEGVTKRGVTLASGGKSVIIEFAQLEHEGIYTCVGTNKGGSLDVDVHLTVFAPPKVGNDESLEVIVGKGVILNCDVEQEGLKSTISWLMNDFETLPPNAQIVLDGRRMYLNEVTSLNEGIYQCRVRNSAGQSTKNFVLSVLEPPSFRDKKYETNIQITPGTAISLTCYVDGHPPPNVQWLRDGENLIESHASISDRNQKLVVQHNDYANHRYTCIATNKAGSISREFLVQVIAPPIMVDSDNYTPTIEVIEGDAVTLECPLHTPFNIMDIEWLKNGRPITSDDPNMQISLDKTRLVIVSMEKEAEDTYICVARNSAGQATREFDIAVIVPPRIIGKAVEYISIVEDESQELECDFEADPIPDIHWSKDGADIGNDVQLLNEKRTALLQSVNSRSAGSYRCGIINKAGRAEKTFNVRIIMKPELENANVTAMIETLTHRPVSFECPLAVTSDANISWTKNSIPLVPGYSDDVQILNGGRQFVISNVKLDDQATYSCVARNKAGEASKNYKLSVFVSPTIISKGGVHKVIENNSLILPCEVEGEPYPTITWMKDGKPALEFTSVQALSEGQQLKIARAGVEHRGSYVCLAQNKVGQAEIGFDVDVITRPTIAEEVKKIAEVIQNDSVVIHCPIIDKRFSGEVTWLKDYQPLKIDGQKYAMSQLSRKLHVNRADLRDEGSYSCRVRNDAGESRVDYKLNVLLPPEILILDKDKNRTAIENSAVTLSCPVTGKPEPIVEWFKDGELLTPLNITERIDTGHLKGNDLKIASVKVVNSGRYTCEAKNKAGMVEQDILLYVMTPPKIEHEEVPVEIGGKSQSALTINCPAYGRPMPAVTWLKSGRPFYHDSDVYLSANGMKLHFLNLKKNDADRYTCIARNPAGEEKRDFTVKLLEAPTIEGPNILHRMQVNSGRTAVINCPAFGSPEPSIAWLKNGQPLGTDNRHTILSGGRQLEINDTSPSDDARYTCIATNNIGLADLETYLQVIDGPVIVGDKQEVIEVLINEAKDLFCDISGTEPIDIEWLRDGKAIEFINEPRSTTSYLQISSRGRILHILSAQISDTARYVCVARNTAGEARKIFDLRVLIPPAISETSSSPPLQTIIPGTSFAVECIVQAVPDAQIIWTRNNRLIKSDNNSIFLNNNQTIWINVARKGLDGRYTCTATNKVGQASRDFIIKLTAPPIIDRSGIQEIEVVAGEFVILTCKILNDGGKLSTKWIIDGQEVDDRRIEIRNARLSDSGSYVCVVENEAGEARKTYELTVLELPRFLDMTNLNPSIIVGRPLLLDCSVTGTPRPVVIWTKQKKFIKT
ncbi:unnamed protein product [Cercopithifilaria johnstoni]|uniref:Ig-like domain-containing protein n=1 Tax=Cercopithifilaria johnstoni TaxID=2874296 RepID=A0A8J2LPA2_9BILA|nr:unnamed protein product [Cercopithifilaria johnstoni]